MSANYRFGSICLVVTVLISGVQAFSLRPFASSKTTALRSVIQSENVDFEFDVGAGGVRLAQESAIQVSGTVKHKPTSATSQLIELQRYNKAVKLSESEAQAALDKAGAKILCTGLGKELFQDPGETVEKTVVLAPKDAVRDALQGAGSAQDYPQLVLNFLGGDELQVTQVLEAAEQMVLALDCKTKCQIQFHSLSDSKLVPDGTSCTLTVVALPFKIAPPGGKQPTSKEGEDDTVDTSKFADFSSAEKAMAMGQVYFFDGSYYTVVEEDLNTAVV